MNGHIFKRIMLFYRPLIKRIIILYFKRKHYEKWEYVSFEETE